MQSKQVGRALYNEVQELAHHDWNALAFVIKWFLFSEPYSFVVPFEGWLYRWDTVASSTSLRVSMYLWYPTISAAQPTPLGTAPHFRPRNRRGTRLFYLYGTYTFTYASTPLVLPKMQLDIAMNSEMGIDVVQHVEQVLRSKLF